MSGLPLRVTSGEDVAEAEADYARSLKVVSGFETSEPGSLDLETGNVCLRESVGQSNATQSWKVVHADSRLFEIARDWCHDLTFVEDPSRAHHEGRGDGRVL